METIFILALIGILLFALPIKGVVKTFIRQPFAVFLCIVFLFPVYLIIAFVELFTGPVEKDAQPACKGMRHDHL